MASLSAACSTKPFLPAASRYISALIKIPYFFITNGKRTLRTVLDGTIPSEMTVNA
jgi:hypothetical protein